MSKWRVPFNDLGRGVAETRPAIDAAIARVLDSGWYVLGPEHDAFESELAEFVGVDHAVGVANGTDALQLALAGLGVQDGDQVLTAANAGGYSSTAIRALGAMPVYADVDPDSLLLTLATIEKAIKRTGPVVTIVVTHLFGAAADVPAIVAWAHTRGIRVLEDCAQALGARFDGCRVGSLGDAAAVSFYPTKNLGALGDGGGVLTSDVVVAQRARQLRQYGWESKYRTTALGGRNSRLDELQAAILRTRLVDLDNITERRQDVHRRYEAAAGPGVRLVNRVSAEFVAHLAVLVCDDRDAVRARMTDAGIATDVHYPIPDHRQPISNSAGLELPVTESAADRMLSVPLFAELRDDEIDLVCAQLGLGA